MKKTFLVLAVTLLPTSIFAQDVSSQYVTQFMQQAIEEGKAIGVAAGVVTQDSLQWEHAEGFMDRDTKDLFTVQTISRTASITKPFTAIAIMQLVEQGKISLEDKISTYLPVFSRDHLKTITIKQVLQHASGLPAYKNKKEANNTIQYNSLEEGLEKFIDRALLFAPGTDFAYSSYGYTVLGIIIENVSKKPYETYLKQHIFDSVGMTNTTIERTGTTYTNKATIYHQSKPGKIKEITNHNISDRIPGGGIQSTVQDLLKFGKAVLNHQLIKKESLDILITNSELKKQGNGYGMGWYLYGNNPTYGNIFGHNGAQYGCSSFIFILPQSKTVTVVLSNTSGFEEVGNIGAALFKVAKELRDDTKTE